MGNQTIVGKNWPSPTWFITRANAPTIAPLLSIQLSGVDVSSAPDIVSLTARAVVSDSDGFVTGSVDIYESGFLVGTAIDGGGGVWNLVLGKLATGNKSYTAKRITMAGSIDSTVWSLAVVNPATIALAWGVTLGQWCRSDTVVQAAGLISQVTDKSGNGRHEVQTAPRQPGFIASDAGFNGQPIIRFVGEGEITANRDQLTVPGWARSAPATAPYWVNMILRTFSPSPGTTNRMIMADSVANCFQIKRPSLTNPSLVMINSGPAANTNSNIVDGTTTVLETYFSGTAGAGSFDYLKLGGVIAVGQGAGNLAGTTERMCVNNNDTAWSHYDWAEKIVVVGGIPPLGFLSGIDAYNVAAYGVAL